MIADPEREPGSRRFGEHGRVIMGEQQRPRLRQEDRTIRGQTDEAGCALQQLAPDAGLQRSQPLADDRLHRTRRLCRPGQVSEIDHKDEEPDGVEV